MSLSSASFFLAIPALWLGWLAAGEQKMIPQALENIVAEEIQSTTPVPAPPAPEKAESYIDISLRMLDRAEKAGLKELKQLRHELNDPLFDLDPGYSLLIATVDQRYKERFPLDAIQSTYGLLDRRLLYRDWGQRDVKAAFAAASQSEPKHLRSFAMLDALDTKNHKPLETLALVRKISDPLLRQRAAARIVQEVAFVAPERFRELSAEFPEFAWKIHTAALTKMAREDPLRALRELESIPTQLSEDLENNIISVWAINDPENAVQWARDNGRRIPDRAVQHWAKVAPTAALQHAAESIHSAYSLMQIAKAAHTADSETTTAFLSNLKDDRMLVTMTMGILGEEEPVTPARKELARSIAQYPQADVDFLQSFSEQINEGKERRDWILSLPPFASRQLIRDELEEWHESDPSTLKTYVQSLPTERAREALLEDRDDSALAEFIHSIAP